MVPKTCPTARSDRTGVLTSVSGKPSHRRDNTRCERSNPDLASKAAEKSKQLVQPLTHPSSWHVSRGLIYMAPDLSNVMKAVRGKQWASGKSLTCSHPS